MTDTGFEIVNTSKGKAKLAYGKIFSLDWPDYRIELHCGFRLKLSKEDGGLGAIEHIKRAKHMLWPHEKKTHTYWFDRLLKAFLANKLTNMTGGAGVGKTYMMSRIIIMYFLTNPSETGILVGTTELNAAGRVWADVQAGFEDIAIDTDFIKSYSGNAPKYLYKNPKTKKVNNKIGIFLKALKRGQDRQAERSLKGFHPPYCLLAIDELDSVPSAVMGVVPNVERGTIEFKFIAAGNPFSRYDTHGLLGKPKDGWDSIDPYNFKRDEDCEWVGESGAYNVFFSCFFSPAVVFRAKEGDNYDDRFHMLVDDAAIDEAREMYGEDSEKFLTYTLGYWPESSNAPTILTPKMLDQHNAEHPAHWGDNNDLIKIAALDPAFTVGGDRIILRYAHLGTDNLGRRILDFGGLDNIKELHIPSKKEKHKFQWLAEEVRKNCIQNNITPDRLAVDVGGSGDALIEKMRDVWGEVYVVRSHGKGTDRLVHEGDKMPASQLYFNKVAELWLAFRSFVLSGQIRGLDTGTCEEFCQRLLTKDQRPLRIETKGEYRKRMAGSLGKNQSPDLADTATYMLDIARSKFGFLAQTRKSLDSKSATLSASFHRQRILADMNINKEPNYDYDDLFSSSYSNNDFNGYEQ